MQQLQVLHQLLHLLLLLLLLLAGGSYGAAAADAAAPRLRTAASTSSQQQHHPNHQHHPSPTAGLRRFFDVLDGNLDGQLQQKELNAYISRQRLAAGHTHSDAAAASVGHLDGADAGADVSMAELDAHLHRVLQAVRVSDWVEHGLGLPQYAAAFSSNSITALDFPLLINDGGRLLEAELQVASPLHRQKLLRAMQRLLLGLGTVPGPPSQLRCSSSSTLGGVVRCTWRPCTPPGEPAAHKWVLQRQSLSAPADAWREIAQLHDHDADSASDLPTSPGSYRYRLSAWNVYGRSPYVVSDEVVVAAGAPAPQQGEQQQQQVQQQVGQGQQVQAQQVWPQSLEQQQQQQQQQQQLVAFDVRGRPQCSSQAAQHHLPPGGAGRMETAKAACAVAGGAGSSDVCQPVDGLVQHMPSSSSSSGSGSSSSSSHTGGAVPVAHQLVVLPAAFSGASQHAAAQPGSVVWLVGPQSHTQAHGLAGSSGDLSSWQAVNSSSAAGIAAMVGRAWMQGISKWLHAAVNSLVLLVVPVCVRLLPVSLLSWLSGRLLLLLPAHKLQQALQQPLSAAADATVAQQAQAGSRPGSRGATAGEAAADAALAAGSGAAGDLLAAGGMQLQQQEQPVPGTAGINCLQPEQLAMRTPRSLVHSCSALELGRPGGLSSSGSGWLRATPSCCSANAATLGVVAGRRPISSGEQPAAADGEAFSLPSPAAVAAAGGGSPPDLLLPQEELQLVAALEHSPGKKRCAFPGCQQAFDLRHLRALLQRHWCGRCQQAFCLAHTAYSPHGPGGSCGAESRCVCIGCFYEFTPEYRCFLSSRNTLASKRTKSGPPAAAAAGGPCAAAAAGGQQQQQQQQQQLGSGSSMPGGPPVLPARRSAVSAPALSVQAARVRAAKIGSACSSGGGGGQDGLVCSPGVKSRMLWDRAWTKASAVVRLSHAGAQLAQRRQLAQQQAAAAEAAAVAATQ